MYKINLLPPELLPGTYIQGKRLFVIAGITLFFGALLIGGGIFFLQAAQIKAELLAGQAELAALKEKSESVAEMRAQRFELEKKTAVLEGLLQQRGAYRPILDGIARCVPVDVWLTGIDVQESKETESPQQAGTAPAVRKSSPAAPAPVMVIKGASRSVPSIGVCVCKLLELPFFSAARLDEFKEQEDGTLAFTITCNLRMGGARFAAKAGQ